MADLGITIFGKYYFQTPEQGARRPLLSDDTKRLAGAGTEMVDGWDAMPGPHIPGRDALHGLNPPPRHHQLRSVHRDREQASHIQGYIYTENKLTDENRSQDD